jgi:hypothetical protein
MASGSALLLSLTQTSPSFADDPSPGPLRLPVAEAQRPLTLPTLILNPSVEVDILRIQAHDAYADLTGQASFGVTDDLTVRALFLPLQLGGPAGQDLHYGQTSETKGPSVGATYRFIRGPVELGAGIDLRVFTAENITGVAIVPTIPLRIHAGPRFRIDAAATVNITRATSTTTGTTVIANPGGGGDVLTPTTTSASANAVRLTVPLSALYNITEPFFVGVSSGLTINNLGNVDNSTGIPVGIFAGYSVGGAHGPILDIEPGLSFPYLVMPGRSEVTNAGEYVVGLSIGGFFYL